MRNVLKIGYKASAEQFGARDLLSFARRAEEAGFDSVAVSDHFQPWRHDGGQAPNALVWLGAAAAATTRVQLGTSVATPTFRYHPAVVAQAAATIESLAPGRFFLGVGTGESMNEVPLGIQWPEIKERFARLKESIELMRRLWTEERVTFDGEYYRTKNATIYERPASGRVPLYIAATGESAARLAGRVADGFICTSGKGEELYTKTLLPAVREGAAKAGRDPLAIEMLIEVKVSYDTDRARALEDTRHWAALALPGDKKVGVEDPIEMQRLASELSIEECASRWIVSNDPDEVAGRVGEYVKMGFGHLVIHGPGPDQERFIQLFQRDVTPRLRKAFAEAAIA
ncbi:MAG TPA: glucose-6-phosphate dehydrogenase (coenzyme-F420) [Candidatus Limnocylindria bacterium]|jgi:coenzyme F420-dependent glucose-6-phosphate dehydrogenase|nr:glucose-6-phosphate dehydrogenase (coenzyme-F420) [Candidatus Limnocylindria bacterium]